MKKVILAALLPLSISSAFADPTAVMKVKGTLTNAACTAELGNGGVIDYGMIRLGELSNQAVNKLGQRQIPVSINCTVPTKVGFSMTDNRSDSNPQLPVDIGNNPDQTAKYYTYGVGTTTDGVKIGNYGMWMTDITADGKAIDTIARNHDWPTDHWQKTTIPRSDGYQTSAFAAPGTTTPVAITTASFNFVTNLVLHDTSTLAITDDTALDGQNTMTLVYL
ncbi:TPA: DUF1120 domain-containing protein [Enterobacter cloacae]|uniref:DUF1120 domain-containing protein n=1 Tax=Enterobacter genomosp. O TaxID=2364150 RepID=A0A0X4EY60_9ENTR|nr:MULTISPECIES: DUF1120 domain-containing protein [Enterobacter cloacae complex]KUQ86654.1 hypothetical protein AWI28_07455 [Enterobacter genomosp. O]MCM7108369.1 DUF1120 domain-containing protein [Enterobacter cloacae]OXU39516.1 hypothetical protein BME83_08065 [Enterobacter cloacae subsp. cloacae]HDC4406523.1 DUF1120 domain-containing protein [Enterobacter cloacae]HDC4602329.1 DUF1120 domain-containing protein [Enterobacter cloacae]